MKKLVNEFLTMSLTASVVLIIVGAILLILPGLTLSVMCYAISAILIINGIIMAYNSYKAIVNMTNDEYLKDALEEIMYDEYLHAKFVRSYLIENDAYDPMQHEELEKAFAAIISD